MRRIRKLPMTTAWSPNPDGSETLYERDGETYVRPLAVLLRSGAAYRVRGPAAFGPRVPVLSGDPRAMAERAVAKRNVLG